MVYEWTDAGGTPQGSGRFGLVREGEGLYRGAWPIAAAALEVGSRIFYHVEARDVAQQANTTRLPLANLFEIEIVARGVLVSFSFEGEAAGVTATGAWERGAPHFGLQAAHSGGAAWMTGVAQAYPAERSVSYLNLPPLDLRGDAPLLVFWHWYDTERGGSCAGFCDGGRVEVSTDEGTTWQATAPLESYPGRVGAATGTPLAGQQAWGGYSYGWQRATVPLPDTSGVRVRFAFATDAGNVEASRYGYAGWAVDDVQVTTLLPDDLLPPLVEGVPASTVQPAGTMPAPFTVEVRDETGVVRVEVRYTFETASGTLRDTLRLEQAPDGGTRFSGTPVLPQPPAAGDALFYTLYAEDAAGNGVTYPETGALEVHFRLLAQADVLGGARATGQWRQSAGRWAVVAAGEAASRSALVLTPADLPANAETVQLRLQHRFRFEEGAGANVKASADGGRTWQVLVPETGYPARLDAPGHPMDGERVFAGALDTLRTVFDLAAFAGQQLRLRLDVGAARALRLGEFWVVDSATRWAASADSAFETPRRLALHAAFPNPFTHQTTIAYTLDAPSSVDLEVYDVLGRRVAVLVAGEPREPDTYTATLDGSVLAAGVYVVRLRAGERQQTRQIVVVR